MSEGSTAHDRDAYTSLKFTETIKTRITGELLTLSSVIPYSLGVVDVCIIDNKGHAWFAGPKSPTMEVRHAMSALPETLHGVIPIDMEPAVPSLHVKGENGIVQSLYAISPQLWLGCRIEMEQFNVIGVDTDVLDRKVQPTLQRIREHLRE